jgi:hypothetical protein
MRLCSHITAVLCSFILLATTITCRVDQDGYVRRERQHEDVPRLSSKRFRTQRFIITLIPPLDLMCIRPINPTLKNTPQGCMLYKGDVPDIQGL